MVKYSYHYHVLETVETLGTLFDLDVNYFPENLDVYIDGPMKIKPEREDRPDGSSVISYMPMTPGAYNISVKFRGKHIKGSPFTAKVSG